MPLRFLSDAQREQLSRLPADLDVEALDRFFTLSDSDAAEVRRRHGDSNRLGWALQLCALRMLGFCPDDVTTAAQPGPGGAVEKVGLGVGVALPANGQGGTQGRPVAAGAGQAGMKTESDPVPRCSWLPSHAVDTAVRVTVKKVSFSKYWCHGVRGIMAELGLGHLVAPGRQHPRLSPGRV
jgi:hypothetical protein